MSTLAGLLYLLQIRMGIGFMYFKEWTPLGSLVAKWKIGKTSKILKVL